MAQGRTIRRRLQQRSRSFTPRARRMLYAAIRTGLPYKRACEICGVKYANFKYWMERGKTDPDHSAYTCFRRYVKRIEARREADLLEVINKVAIGNYKVRETEISFHPDKGQTFKRKTKVIRPDWKAAAWYLERKYRDEYGHIDPNANIGRTAEDIAADIHRATQALEASVPIGDAA